MLTAALPLLAALAPETDSIVLIDENGQEIEYPDQNCTMLDRVHKSCARVSKCAAA